MKISDLSADSLPSFVPKTTQAPDAFQQISPSVGICHTLQKIKGDIQDLRRASGTRHPVEPRWLSRGNAQHSGSINRDLPESLLAIVDDYFYVMNDTEMSSP
ncbi:MAG: hypothetical protein P8077_05925, partial [Gammaproteobacteria bacterium]